MSTVQSQVLRLAQRVDPFTKAGAELVAGTIGTVAGDRFTAQRLLDCYNEARFALIQAINTAMDSRQKAIAVSGTITRNATATFASGVLAKPTGYIEAVSLLTAAGKTITILPVSSLSYTRYLDSAINPVVYEHGVDFRSENGSAYIPDAATYVFRYYGIVAFVLTDVTNGTSLETFNTMFEPVLIELAEAIASEQGAGIVNGMALRLIEQKKVA